jgi:hypothetical protein
MTDFDYMSATTQDLESKLSELGLSVEVDIDEARTYQFKPLSGPTEPDITEVSLELRTLTLLGRIVTHTINQDTQPPEFVKEWALSKGLGTIAGSRESATAVSACLEPILQKYIRFSSMTAVNLEYIGITRTILINSTSQSFRTLISKLLNGRTRQEYRPDEVIDLQETGSDPAIDTSSLLGLVVNKRKGFIHLIVKAGTLSWAYATIGSRVLGGDGLPSFHEAAEDGSDLWGAAEWFNSTHGTLLKRVMKLPLSRLGVHLSGRGLCYIDTASFEGEEREIVIPFEGGISLLKDMMAQRPQTFGCSSWTPPPPDLTTTSLGHFLRVHTIANRMLRPCTLCLDDSMEYHGPREYRHDPVTALVIRYAQTYKDRLLASDSPFYKGTTLSLLEKTLHPYIGYPSGRAKANASITMQMIKAARIISTENLYPSLPEALSKKSILEIFSMQKG